MNEQIFTLQHEHIALCDLLKATALAPSGGVAKLMIAAGDVLVDGAIETRKTAKIRPGMVVECLGEQIKVVAA
ncbi:MULTISPECIES: RNA-binding S4 domain-containing protein [Chitinibacter]|uniref:RNA-binding S4 domain-containing protein n=1 Tax=Chitinibacter TaxID=230666 RepID=UPI00048F00CB|nr:MULTISPECIES: RNA-binding S4 domain-containing protein [Chitinibacter]